MSTRSQGPLWIARAIAAGFIAGIGLCVRSIQQEDFGHVLMGAVQFAACGIAGIVLLLECLSFSVKDLPL